MEQERVLTDKQQAFIDHLFGDAEGDMYLAKKMAGYSDNTLLREVTDYIQEELYEATKAFLARQGPKAAMSLKKIMDSPTTPGGRELLATAKDVLDRNNFKPKEQVEITTETPIFFLPEKNKDED